MKWIPKVPVESFVPFRKSVLDFKITHKFDFEKEEFAIENGRLVEIDGFDAFKEKVKNFVRTPKEHSHGLMNDIFISEDQHQFEIEAQKLANDLVSQVLKSSTAASPSGLGHTIEEIESIESVVKDEQKFLLITMKATGVNGYLTVEVPFPTF